MSTIYTIGYDVDPKSIHRDLAPLIEKTFLWAYRDHSRAGECSLKAFLLLCHAKHRRIVIGQYFKQRLSPFSCPDAL